MTLTKVKVHFDPVLSYAGFLHPRLAAASDHLHHLYGRTIEKVILAAGQEEATNDFLDAFGGNYTR